MSTNRRNVTARKPKSTTRRDLVSGRILEEAAALFAKRGFSETSLQEVADALGISRTALYHYIGGKDELLATLVKGLSRDTAENMEKLASDESLGPLERLREAVRGQAVRIATNPARFRLLLMSEGALEEPVASEHRKARRRTLDALARIITDGVRTGVIRPVDSHQAAFALFGMCNWVAWWYRPERPDGKSPEDVADQITDIGVAGLRAVDGRASMDTNDDVKQAIAHLRQDLDMLQSALDARENGSSTRRPTGARNDRRR